MTQKACLVTGASSGIGKEIALSLAQSGAHVIIVCRNTDKGNKTLDELKKISGSSTIDLLVADLSSQAEIRLLAEKIHQRYKKLNILINNAGVVLYKKMFSRDGIEMTLATNFLGPFLLTQLLIDLLEKNAPSRIINISSNAHRWANLDLADLQYEQRKYQCMKVYAQSKLLINLFTLALASKLEGTGITVNCAHPGAVKTNIGRDSVDTLALKFLDRFIKFFCITPKKAAQNLCYLAMSPDLETVTGKYFAKCKPVVPSPSSLDFTLANNIWKMSEKMVGTIA